MHFAGQLTTHNYGAPISWDTDGGAIQDNPARHDYNLDEMVRLARATKEDAHSSAGKKLTAACTGRLSLVSLLLTLGAMGQVDSFIKSAQKLQNITRLNHQMWPCGSDFQYQNADHWYHNLDKIIHYVNLDATRGGPVVAFYSTPR